MYEIFKDLIDARGLKPADVAKGANIPPSTFTDWKKGRSTPKDEKLQKIADFLGVTLEYLKGIDDYEEVCPICRKRYSPNDSLQVKNHEKYHESYLSAEKKYGNHLFFKDREELKRNAYEVINNESSSSEQIAEAYLDIFKAYFFRSLEYSKFDLRHPEFEEYVPMLLNQKYFAEEIPLASKDILIKKFGTSNGLPEGETDYNIPISKNATLTSRDERDIKKDLDSLMEKLTNKEYGPAAFDGDDIPEDDQELFAGQLELMLRRLKTINKKKYNPHKNKK